MSLSTIFLVCFTILVCLYIGALALLERRRSLQVPLKDPTPPESAQRTLDEVIALSRRQERDIERLMEVLHKVPGKVLDSITSSGNTNKGKLGELIAYLGIRASYDRIIPLNDIVDFLGVRLPRNGEDGEVAFIEVKSGDSARLNKDQTALKRLIKEKKVVFVEFRIEADSCGSNGKSEPDRPGAGCSIRQQPSVSELEQEVAVTGEEDSLQGITGAVQPDSSDS